MKRIFEMLEAAKDLKRFSGHQLLHERLDAWPLMVNQKLRIIQPGLKADPNIS